MEFDGLLSINQKSFSESVKRVFPSGERIIPTTLFPHLSTLEPCKKPHIPNCFSRDMEMVNFVVYGLQKVGFSESLEIFGRRICSKI